MLKEQVENTGLGFFDRFKPNLLLTRFFSSVTSGKLFSTELYVVTGAMFVGEHTVLDGAVLYS